ncbi:response regulator [Nodosilinea sp. LEGE 07088]|uniref:response regulator n=1 Tax=Nodosilinea sp. LEGE 07088 TaxID=2777968 RepID=UPI00187E02A5|nr:response regulator [Nodosilinea sp. LEGE 07088]MBE9137409.1 response regulator [Nodosilinea sp. LEGE 07088]
MHITPINQSKKEILVVDDTPDNLRLLSAILTQHNYEVRKALNGSQAIASVNADAPDLILLDIKMPGIDGFEICTTLKQDPACERIPVIFISALDDALDKVKAFSVGGADYITKPFQEAEVLARIENQLHILSLQEQLKKQNEELARSNQALEQFAYVVAHDLQQPLQSVLGYAAIINLKYSESLDSSVNGYLEKISEAGTRMQRLIQDLLRYAQIGKQDIDCLKLDGNVILSKALDNIALMLQESHAKLTYADLPTLFGNESQIVQLFQNLIGNAVKFAQPGTNPKIEIAVSPVNNYWLFTIHDHGIGISPDNLSHVFKLFYRSKSDEKIHGSGIGLAVCKKIVESHGGQIWVTSELNVGTTFSFTMPVNSGTH